MRSTYPKRTSCVGRRSLMATLALTLGMTASAWGWAQEGGDAEPATDHMITEEVDDLEDGATANEAGESGETDESHQVFREEMESRLVEIEKDLAQMGDQVPEAAGQEPEAGTDVLESVEETLSALTSRRRDLEFELLSTTDGEYPDETAWEAWCVEFEGNVADLEQEVATLAETINAMWQG